MPAARSTVVSSVGRGAGPALVGLAQRVEAEGLRRLDADQAGAVDRLVERLADARERVADRQHRRRAFEEFERREQPVDDRGRAEGPRGIVDQHRVAVDRGEAGADRVRALRAAFDQVRRRRVRRAPAAASSCCPAPITTRTRRTAG